jgi:hypothetical protein
VIGLFRVIDQLHALALGRLARVDAHGVAPAQWGTSTASWLRHHAGLPSGTSSDMVSTARELHTHLPDTAQALRRGEVTVQHARTIARTARLVQARTGDTAHEAAAAEVEQVMLDVAKAVDAGSLAGFSRRIRQVVDPDGARREAERAHERRWLSASQTIDGMVALDGMLDAEAGAVFLTALAATSAPRGPDDRRSASQRRADGLVDICGLSLDHALLGSSGGARPHLLVTAPLHALAGPAARGSGPADPPTPGAAEVAEVAWTGALLDETVRRLACDASVRRVVLDPQSLPLDVGRSTRTVPVHLREALAVRDRGCVAAGCDRPVAWTEAHHVVHWAEGGTTSLDNLVLLCRSHHRKVHEGGWEFTRAGTSWRLVPPQGDPPPPPGSHSRADDTSDHVGDAGCGGAEPQLPEAGVQPRPDRDP